MATSVNNEKEEKILAPIATTASGGRRKSLSDEIVQGQVDTVDTNARWLAYGARLRTAIRASTRYLAYSSDVGEAFRPIVHPLIVRAAYGVSWAYVGLDVAYEGYKTHKAGNDNAVVGVSALKRGVFQTFASMLLPMATIHTAVKYSAKHVFNNMKNTKIKTWGPTATGLAILPLLPYMYDEVVEHIVDRAFEPLEKKILSEKEAKSVPPVAHNIVNKSE
ncbi:mitochondrial 18 KDa protein-domain-containing protein [Umbelopsis sp. PMI_123]|nr:mitochondrial 18 KDa protein-domain-containing protein [Umbelopsis sp. PMI_123]